MKAKKNILVFIDWFYPGFLAGGPVQSIVSLVEHLHDEFQFWIFTSNRDLNSTESYPEVKNNVWVESPLNCNVYYADQATLSKRLISNILAQQKWDKVYINSLFSKFYSIIPLLLLKSKFKHLPVIVAPRGMFGAGALSIKRFKKKGFLFYAKHSGLHKRVVWHAASEREAIDIKQAFGDTAKVSTISNLPKRAVSMAKQKKKKGQLNLLFLSRISPVKNVLFAIEILSKVKTKGLSLSLELYGLMEDEDYWKKCADKIAELPKTIMVEYKGTYLPENIVRVLDQGDALFLPTLNENYGHSIVESLGSGCPAIISDQTPWKDLQEYGAGYALPLNHPQAFVDAIEKMAAMDEMEFSQMRKNAILYIQSKINSEKIVQQYKVLLND